ncbi:MAG: hypothetical protein K0U98_06120 [Deltaproteobacteria bacterium]|nr:hypothetical protein [Deltaproteobacteria bacterium]
MRRKNQRLRGQVLEYRDASLLVLSKHLNSRQMSQIRVDGVKLRNGRVIIVFEDRLALVLDGDDALPLARLRQHTQSPSERFLNLASDSCVRKRLSDLRSTL